MHFKYCPDCGKLLSGRVLGDEGVVPWCDDCGRPWFDMFPIAAIALVYNDEGEVLLLRQNYISTTFHNLVSGYITPGESAEECIVREIREETGLEVEAPELKLTAWFPKKEMLMVGFFAKAKGGELRLSGEVDAAAWHPWQEVLGMVGTAPWSTSRKLAQLFTDIQNSKADS